MDRPSPECIRDFCKIGKSLTLQIDMLAFNTNLLYPNYEPNFLPIIDSFDLIGRTTDELTPDDEYFLRPSPFEIAARYTRFSTHSSLMKNASKETSYDDCPLTLARSAYFEKELLNKLKKHIFFKWLNKNPEFERAKNFLLKKLPAFNQFKEVEKENLKSKQDWEAYYTTHLAVQVGQYFQFYEMASKMAFTKKEIRESISLVERLCEDLKKYKKFERFFQTRDIPKLLYSFLDRLRDKTDTRNDEKKSRRLLIIHITGNISRNYDLTSKELTMYLVNIITPEGVDLRNVFQVVNGAKKKPGRISK